MASELDRGFIDNLDKLSDYGWESYRQHKFGFGGVWSLPPIGGNWLGDIFDFTLLGYAFDRNNLADQYSNVINSSVIEDDDLSVHNNQQGTLADAAAIKAQVGILEQREQAFRARHTTPIMATCHAAARRKGHGETGEATAGIFSVMIDNVSNIINHGQ